VRAFGQEVVVRRVWEVLKPIARQCVIISFDLAAVHHVRQVSSLRIGWVLSEYSNLSALKCEALAPDYVFCDHRLLSADNARLWRGPWRWAIYEVTTRKLALELAARGAKLIETMAVRTMLRELRASARP
jgi:glycerophosphoryl diester phosphodiesterase